MHEGRKDGTIQSRKDPVGVGLVGFGLAGSVFHAPLLRADAQFDLTRIVTSRRDELDRAGCARTMSSFEALLADPDIELVVLATPNETHAPLASAGLRAGKHVVIDKPMAVTLAEAEALVLLAAERGRLLSVFQNRRWDGDFRTVRMVVEEQRVGALSHYEAHYDRFRPAVKAGWREESTPGAGLLFDLGSHLVDQALVLFGLPRAVTADVLVQRQSARAPDYAHLVLDYGRLRAVLHVSNLVCKAGPRFILHGDRGSFVKHGLDGQEAALKVGVRPGMPGWGEGPREDDGMLTSSDGGEVRVPTMRGSYELYYHGIWESIRNGAPPPVTAAEGRDVIRVLEAAARSAIERRTVAILG